MKSRETKQKDLTALQESLQNSKSAVVVTFSGLTVTKDQEFRKSLREAGASYQVVKNTLARIAVKGTQFEEATDHFKGVTAIAWTQDDPVVLTKAISKFLKDNADIYKYKTGVLDGKVIDYTQLQSIANLPSKDELISKLLFVLSSSARGIVTVINAVPRNLAIVIKQIGDAIPAEAPAPAPEVKAEEPKAEEVAPVEAAALQEPPTEETPATEEAAAPTEATASNEAPAEEAPAEEAAAEEAPAAEAAPAETDAVPEIETPPVEAHAADDAAAEIVGEPAPEPVATSTEAESETVTAAPDDASEAAADGETLPEPEATADGEATE